MPEQDVTEYIPDRVMERHPRAHHAERRHRLAGARRAGDGQGGRQTGTATKIRPRTKRPSLYRVLLLNDDYTPMEFVIGVLQEVFSKTPEDAFQIMMHVHKSGVGECGVYPFEIAETKVMRVMDAAQKNQHPLQCVMEKQ